MSWFTPTKLNKVRNPSRISHRRPTKITELFPGLNDPFNSFSAAFANYAFIMFGKVLLLLSHIGDANHLNLNIS